MTIELQQEERIWTIKVNETFASNDYKTAKRLLNELVALKRQHAQFHDLRTKEQQHRRKEQWGVPNGKNNDLFMEGFSAIGQGLTGGKRR